MNLYETIRVARDATADEIKAAYRTKARAVHPDNPHTGDAEAFARLKDAYDVLQDPAKRAHYDATGETSKGPTVDRGAEAVSRVAAAIRRALMKALEISAKRGCLPLSLDILNLAKNQLCDHRAENDAMIVQITERRDYVQGAIDRLVCTGTEDPIGAILRQDVKTLDKQMQDHELEKELIDLALKVFDNYEWQKDQDPLMLDFSANFIFG